MHMVKSSMVFIFLIFINIFLTERVGTYVAIQIMKRKQTALHLYGIGPAMRNLHKQQTPKEVLNAYH